MKRFPLVRGLLAVWILACFASYASAAKWGHVAPSSSSTVLTAGAGLTGGGDLSADRTFNVAANADGSIVANANDIQVGVLATDAQHGNRGGGALHSAATTGANGFMSAADKTKLDAWLSSPTTFSLASTSTGVTLCNTVDCSTNYERVRLLWDSNAAILRTEASGGTLRSLIVGNASYSVTLPGSGTTGMFLNGGSSNQFVMSAATGGTGVRLQANLTTQAIASLDFRNGNTFTGSSGTQSIIGVFGTFNQTGAAAGQALLLNPTFTACGSGGCNFLRAVDNATERWRIDSAGAQDVDSTVTTGGTTGNQTINKPAGTVNVAAAGTAVTVTNSLVTANSIISVVARTNDGTCAVKNYVPAAGSFVINLTAGCTAETSIGFALLDKN